MKKLIAILLLIVISVPATLLAAPSQGACIVGDQHEAKTGAHCACCIGDCQCTVTEQDSSGDIVPALQLRAWGSLEVAALSEIQNFKTPSLPPQSATFAGSLPETKENQHGKNVPLHIQYCSMLW